MHNRRIRRFLIAGSIALAACAARPAATAPAPALPPTRDDGALRVTLTWAAPVDLDLYVTDPVGETLYFANNPTRAGARLERDARCEEVPAGTPRVEVARLADPAPGRYRVGVDFIDTCGAPLVAAAFRVAVDRGASRREADGIATLSQFKVIVLEFEVDEDDGGTR
jgi:uncharacterized protein YfaP (DUF2135 family)